MPVVGDRHQSVGPDYQFRIRNRGALRHIFRRDLHFDEPALRRQGMYRIGGKIHDNLVDLGRVTQNNWSARKNLDSHIDRRWDARTKKVHCLLHHLRDPKRFQVLRLLATKRQYLLNKQFGAVRRLEHLPSGTGVVLDDVMVGLYGNVILWLILDPLRAFLA